jgi:hypothetical protein
LQPGNSALHFTPFNETNRGGVISNTGNFNAAQYIGWLRMAVLVEFERAIDINLAIVVCPFERWVRERYSEIGIDDDERLNSHLKKMCTETLRISEDGGLTGGDLQPSQDYCNCATRKAPANIHCYFKSVMKNVLAPDSAVGDFYRQSG